MLSFIIKIIAGALMGAAFGHFWKCSPRACSFASNWKRGALFGAVLGLMVASLDGDGGAALDASTRNLTRISEAQFETEVLRSKIPVALEFYGPSCPPCVVLSKQLEKVAENYTNKIRFVKINIQEAPKLARQYDVEGVPTVLLFKGGQQVADIEGVPPPEELIPQLNLLIEN